MEMAIPRTAVLRLGLLVGAVMAVLGVGCRSKPADVSEVFATRITALGYLRRSQLPEAEAEFKKPILEKYEREGSAFYSTARLWDDGVIDPLDTRQAVALAISLSLNAPIPDHRFGVFRM